MQVIKDIKQLQAQLQATGEMTFSGGWQRLRLIWQSRIYMFSCLQCFCNSADVLPRFSTPRPEPGFPQLIMFIDDLDRVPPTKIVEVLEAVNQILTACGITSVIGAVSSRGTQYDPAACTTPHHTTPHHTTPHHTRMAQHRTRAAKEHTMVCLTVHAM
jgi:hypothetical protein